MKFRFNIHELDKNLNDFSKLLFFFFNAISICRFYLTTKNILDKKVDQKNDEKTNRIYS